MRRPSYALLLLVVLGVLHAATGGAQPPHDCSTSPASLESPGDPEAAAGVDDSPRFSPLDVALEPNPPKAKHLGASLAAGRPWLLRLDDARVRRVAPVVSGRAAYLVTRRLRI